MTPAAIDSPRAWSVAVAGAVASGTAFGTAYTFGAFFDAMADELGSGRGATSLMFGITLLAFFGLGVVSGPLVERVGPRRVVVAGAALMAAGLVATSRVDHVAVGYATYGLGVGVGGGLIVTPMFSTTGGWFVRRRAVALGVTATGNGLGTLVLVPLAERLISAHGWRTSYLILAGIDAVLLCAAAAVLAPAPVPPPPPALERMRQVWATAAFRRLFLTSVLFSVSLFIAFAFVVDFATDEGVSSSRAALLVGIIGASSVVGRLGLTAAAARLPAVRIMQLSLAAQPVAFLVWLVAGGRYPLLVVFAVLLGTSYGGFVAIGPEVAAHLWGVKGLGGVMGLMFASAGVGGLIGPPVAGVLADLSEGQAVPIGFAVAVAVVATYLAAAIPTDPEPGWILTDAEPSPSPAGD